MPTLPTYRDEETPALGYNLGMLWFLLAELLGDMLVSPLKMLKYLSPGYYYRHGKGWRTFECLCFGLVLLFVGEMLALISALQAQHGRVVLHLILLAVLLFVMAVVAHFRTMHEEEEDEDE